MGTQIIIGVWFALWMVATPASEVRADAISQLAGIAVQEAPATGGDTEGNGIFKWEQDLRQFSFRLLKSVRRWSIRSWRLVQRSALYWATWAAAAGALLLFGGVVSVIDKRIVLLAWEQGARTGLVYAWIGLVVFLRLLRDPRVGGRLRLIVPAAIVYSFLFGGWLQTGVPVLNVADDLLVTGLASRWFVRRCPDAVIEQHATYARLRAQPLLPIPAGSPPDQN